MGTVFYYSFGFTEPISKKNYIGVTSKSAPIGLYIFFQGNPDYMKKVHTTSTISKYIADTPGTTEPLKKADHLLTRVRLLLA